MSQPQPVTHNPQSMIPSTNQWTPNVGVPMSTAATGLPGNSHPQWTPDFPQPRTEKAHGKFVPMQYRTQPANLPGGIKRQGTSIGNIDKGETDFNDTVKSLYVQISKTGFPTREECCDIVDIWYLWKLVNFDLVQL